MKLPFSVMVSVSLLAQSELVVHGATLRDGSSTTNLLVVKVETGSLLDELGIRRDDRLIKVNGRTVTKARELRTELADPDDRIEIELQRNGRTVVITRAGIPTGRAFYLGMSDDEGVRLLASHGFGVDAKGGLPPDLQRYDLIVLGYADRLRSTDASALERYLRNGGGVVMFYNVPHALAGNAHELGPIYQWFGAALYAYSHMMRDEATLTLCQDRPFGSSLRKGDTYFAYRGGAQGWPAVSRLADSAIPIATWGRIGDTELIGMFSNEYGKGRLAYLGGLAKANKVHWELFASAAKWATRNQKGR